MDKDLLIKYRTLGAISVVVILSMFFISSFVSLKEKKDLGFRAKMFYSDLSQAIQYSYNENGLPGQWGFVEDDKNINLINNYLLNTLRVSINCLEATSGCAFSGYYKNLGNKNTKLNIGSLPSVRLHNGTTIAFETKSACLNPDETCLWIYADLNGVDAPNVIGKDLLVFELKNSSSSYFKLLGLSDASVDILNDKIYGCSKKATQPLFCSAVLFTKNWQFDKSYPW